MTTTTRRTEQVPAGELLAGNAIMYATQAPGHTGLELFVVDSVALIRGTGAGVGTDAVVLYLGGVDRIVVDSTALIARVVWS